MHGFQLVRAVFAAVVIYSATLIQPVPDQVWVNAAIGLAVAAVIIFAETRLRDAAVTKVLGGLIGFGIGLTIANMISRGLFWADTASTQVRFLHGLVIVVLPY